MNPNKQLEAVGRAFMRYAMENQELQDLLEQAQARIKELEARIASLEK